MATTTVWIYAFLVLLAGALVDVLGRRRSPRDIEPRTAACGDADECGATRPSDGNGARACSRAHEGP